MSTFNFSEAFIDDTGKTSMSRLGQFCALVVSTLGFIYLTVDNDMTEWYFTVYMGAWVVNSVTHKGIEAWASAKTGDSKNV